MGTSVADIFISYSKPDRDKVVLLAAYLESEGWSVWWDSSLAIGDAYRDEIMKQLALARAVIVLWTPTSVKSDFVRAEAGRAKADGKLIPVKDGISYGDIPLPFGEMHTEDLAKRDLIRAAVVAQLARPQVQPNTWWVAAKTLRYQVLTWIGIVGGAITIFTHLREVLWLAEWAKLLVANWQSLTVAFWQFWLGWIGIRLSATAALGLSLATFTIAVAIGARGDARRVPAVVLSPQLQRRQQRTMRLLPWLFAFLVACCIGLIAYIHIWSPFAHQPISQLVVRDLAAVLLLLMIGLPGYVLSIKGFYIEHYVDRGLFLLMQGFVFAVFVVPLMTNLASDQTIFDDEPWGPVYAFGLLSLMFLPSVVMLLIAPVRTLNRRLSFLGIGVMMLIVLNQLSLYAPEIRQWLRPPV
jgi:TIR domain